MKVTLLPELFDPPIHHTLLVTLLRYPLEERHRVELDSSHSAVVAWFAHQSPGMREELELALELSTQAEALEPSRLAVRIVRSGPADFESAPFSIPLDDSRRFLDSPFVILLEDERADRAFLERMLTEEERRFLQRRIAAGAVRIDHGGGVGPMTRRAIEAAEDPAERHRLWILFDSDAMQPGSPSADSERLRATCSRIAHHQLRRRYMESYLPRQALQTWANVSDRAERDDRIQRYRAFSGMQDRQRHHYNMKQGFDRDARRTDASAGTLYADVSEQDRRALARGFGEDIGDLFAGTSVTEAHLRRDTSGWEELRPVLLDLLARIR